jgi:hypothetical protein
MGDFLGRDNITTLELELLGPLITLLVGLLSNESRQHLVPILLGQGAELNIVVDQNLVLLLCPLFLVVTVGASLVALNIFLLVDIIYGLLILEDYVLFNLLIIYLCLTVLLLVCFFFLPKIELHSIVRHYRVLNLLALEPKQHFYGQQVVVLLQLNESSHDGGDDLSQLVFAQLELLLNEGRVLVVHQPLHQLVVTHILL